MAETGAFLHKFFRENMDNFEYFLKLSVANPTFKSGFGKM